MNELVEATTRPLSHSCAAGCGSVVERRVSRFSLTGLGERVNAALLFCVSLVFGGRFMVMLWVLALVLLAHFVRVRLVVADDELEIRNTFRTYRFRLDSPTTLIWVPVFPYQWKVGGQLGVHVRSEQSEWVFSRATAISAKSKRSQLELYELVALLQSRDDLGARVFTGASAPAGFSDPA